MNAERRDFLWLTALGVAGVALAARFDAAMAAYAGANFDIRSFGASGDGKSIDSPAINRAIAAAAAAGGGVVRLPAGTYACYSIRLASFVTLLFEPGATILAASPPGYDAAESNVPWEAYQDFGHNHWHNSLIWGEKLRDVALLGPGRIWGRGLSRGEWPEAGLPPADAPGAGDKAIALKRCRNVILRDFSILAGGHFGILATGVDNLAIDGISIDANRDGMDIDACRNVYISNCSVNAPSDDGICLKSSFALGEVRATENVTISACHVTGYKLGTVLDGTFEPLAPATGQTPTGRIKLGTESNGGFRNISISNCTFESCRGFALETVDGGALEDISFTGVTMRDIRNAPFFLRLGARLRGPPGITVGTLRRIIISDVVCDAPTNAMPAIISGIPGHFIEDVTISNVYLVQRGGVSTERAAIDPPEEETDYPEPSRFGPLPAQALFMRHARNVAVDHLEIASKTPDARPVCWLRDVDDAAFTRFKPPPNAGRAAFLLQDTRRFRITASAPVPDTTLDTVHQKLLP
jgi:polygalacturonase